MSSASTTTPNKRNPFRKLSVVPVLVIAAVMVSATNTALADQRHRGNSPRFSTPYTPSWGTDFRSHVSHVNRPGSRFNSRFNSRFDRHYNRDFNRSFNRNVRRHDFTNNRFRNRFGDRFRNRFDNHGSSYRYRPSRYDGWSVSLNLGSASSAWYGSGVGIGRNYYGAGLPASPFIPYRNRTSVIVNQPTVVYVNDSSRVTGQVVHRETVKDVRPARSLLRDIHGDCFERTYDGNGREMRIQLPAAACNF